MYKVEYTLPAIKQLKKMDKHISALIIGWIEPVESAEKSLHFMPAYAIITENTLRQITKGERLYYDYFL